MGKRPFAMLGAAVYAALAAGAALGGEGAAALAGICAGAALCGTIIYCRRRKRRGRGISALILQGTAALITATLSLVLFCGEWGESAQVQYLGGQTGMIEGRIVSGGEHQYGRIYYEVEIERVWLGETPEALPKFTLRLSTQQAIPCEVYDYIECMVAFFIFEEGGLYSQKNRRLAEGISLRGYITDYGSIKVTPGEGFSLKKGLYLLRERMSRGFSQSLPEKEAALLQAIVLGNREGIYYTGAQEDFRRLGASHLLVISGLHIGAIAGLFSLILGRVFRRRWIRSLLAAAGVVGFLLVIGMPVSAMRSGIMIITALIGNCFGRRQDGVNTLGLAVVVLCISDPFSAMDMGLSLSLGATFGIIAIYPKIRRRLYRHLPKGRLKSPCKWVYAGIGATASAAIMILPIQLAEFGGVPLLSAVGTIILLLPCTLMLYLGLFAGVVGLIPKGIIWATPIYTAAGWVCRIVTWITESCRGLALTEIPAGNGAWIIAMTGAGCIIGAKWAMEGRTKWERGQEIWKRKEKGKKGKPGAGGLPMAAGVRRAVAAGIATLMIAAGGVSYVSYANVATIAIAEEGCVMLIKDGRACALSLGGYNTGRAKELLEENNGFYLESVIMPDAGTEAKASADALLKNHPETKIYLPQGEYVGALPKERVEFIYGGDEIEALPGVRVSVNREGTALRLKINDTAIMVEFAPGSGGDCDLLITNQGGSRINSSFTVFQSDDIMEENINVGEGMILLPGLTDGVTIDLKPHKRISIR